MCMSLLHFHLIFYRNHVGLNPFAKGAVSPEKPVLKPSEYISLPPEVQPELYHRQFVIKDLYIYICFRALLWLRALYSEQNENHCIYITCISYVVFIHMTNKPDSDSVCS